MNGKSIDLSSIYSRVETSNATAKYANHYVIAGTGLMNNSIILLHGYHFEFGSLWDIKMHSEILFEATK